MEPSTGKNRSGRRKPRSIPHFLLLLIPFVTFPRKFYELDEAGKPVHYSPYNGQVLPGYMFTDTGFFGIPSGVFFPLLNLMYPSMNKEMQEGLINTYKESGFFPEWASPGHRDCMIGNNSASVLADAYLKGIKVEDVKNFVRRVNTRNKERTSHRIFHRKTRIRIL